MTPFLLSPEWLDLACRLEEQHEGFSETPYPCTAGKMTVGIGYNFQDRGLADLEQVIGRKFDGRITHPEARAVLRADLLRIGQDLARRLSWFARLDPVRQIALIDMGMMGVPKLMKFTTTLPAIERGDWMTAAAGIRGSKWARDVKQTRAGRVARMIETGLFPTL